MNSVIIDTALTLLVDFGGTIRKPIHNGMVEFHGRRYQLAFVIRRDAYEAMVATTCRADSYECKPYDMLFSIPLSVTCSDDAPMVSLRIEPMTGESQNG